MWEGREFFVLTDHKPLYHTLGRLFAPCCTRQQRHLAYVSEFTQDIQHIPGEENVAANSRLRPPQLSCLAPSALPPFLNTKALSAGQTACSAMAALAADQCLHIFRRLLADGHMLLCSTLTGVDHPLLPPEFHRPAVDALHALSHPDVRSSHRLLTLSLHFLVVMASSPQASSPTSCCSPTTWPPEEGSTTFSSCGPTLSWVFCWSQSCCTWTAGSMGVM